MLIKLLVTSFELGGQPWSGCAPKKRLLLEFYLFDLNKCDSIYIVNYKHAMYIVGLYRDEKHEAVRPFNETHVFDPCRFGVRMHVVRGD